MYIVRHGAGVDLPRATATATGSQPLLRSTYSYSVGISLLRVAK